MWFQAVLLNTCYVLLFLLSTIYIYFKYIYQYWAKENIPYLEPTFPFGNVRRFIFQKETFGVTFKNVYDEIKKKTRLCGGFYFLSKPQLIPVDPELIKSILTKDFAHFHDRNIYYDEPSDPLSVNLVFINGARWKNLRTKMTPTFTSGKMKMMFNTILACSNELGNILDTKISQKEPLDLRDIFARLATDTIGSCAFGIDCNSLKYPDNEFRKYGKKIFEFKFKDVIINLVATNWPGVLRFFQIPVTPPDVTEFFMNILRETLEYREKNNVTRKDFLDLMIKLKNKESIWEDLDEKTLQEGISFNELAAQAFIFFAAGFETSSSTLNFCMYELCLNQQVQEKVRREVVTVLKKHNGELSYDAIMEMKYMDKVFDEVLRMYPPIPTLGRECTADYKIPNTDLKIKKGTEVVISTLGLQRDPEHFPNPDQFDPERFSEEQKKTRHPFTYLPFGEGPRNCIGMRFALLQVKIVLSTIIKDYKFKLNPKTKVPVEFDPGNPFLTPIDTILVDPIKIMK